MARNNVNVKLINNDIPIANDPVAEPIVAFKTSSVIENEGVFDVPSDYALDFVKFTIQGNEEHLIPTIYDFEDTPIPTVEATNPDMPVAGQYTAVFDATTFSTTFTFFFESVAVTIAYQKVKLFLEFVQKEVIYTSSTYIDQIDNHSPLTSSEKVFFKEQMRLYFLQSNGMTYAKVFYFNIFDTLKSYQISIQNPDIACFNFYSKDMSKFADKNFRHWFSYNNETKEEISQLKTTYINDNGFSNIVMVQSEQNALPIIISSYFGRVSGFIATNIQGYQVQGLDPIKEETRKSLYRDNNILFYTLLNEDYKDGQTQLKEGVALDNIKIDMITSLNWVVNQARLSLINTFFSSGGDNTKLDAIESTGGRVSIYTTSLNIFFTSLIRNRIILSYDSLTIKVEQTQDLNIIATVNIRYNKSVDVIQLTITNQPAILGQVA